MVASMSNRRIAAGLVVVNRFLYAVGGSNGQERLNSMEKYYPEEDRWMNCPPMSTIRSGAGVCYNNKPIIIIIVVACVCERPIIIVVTCVCERAEC